MQIVVVVADLKINTKEIPMELLSHLICKLEHATKVEKYTSDHTCFSTFS